MSSLPLKSGPARKPSRSGVARVASFGDDAQLVEAVLRGEPRAQREVLRRYGGRVHSVLLRVLGPDEELADLLQEVFVAAFDDLRSLRDPAKLGAWLARIAVRKARALIQRRRRRAWLRSPAEVSELPAPAQGEPGQVVAREVMGVLAQLPVDLRIAFALRFIEQMELSEVAEACGCSLATIKRRLRKAERRFRALAERSPTLREELEQREGRGRA